LKTLIALSGKRMLVLIRPTKVTITWIMLSLKHTWSQEWDNLKVLSVVCSARMMVQYVRANVKIGFEFTSRGAFAPRLFFWILVGRRHKIDASLELGVGQL
jgi:hypothetical protein